VIVIDTSALMALLLAEPTADQIATVLEAEEHVIISAGTLAEALIVAARRGLLEEMTMLLDGIGAKVETVSEQTSYAVAEAYAAWGKGVHPAGLNFGDCFAYVTAKAHNAPLLFVGNDFSQTDVASVI